MLFCVSTETASGSTLAESRSARLLGFSSSSGSRQPSMRTSDRRAALSADRSPFVACVRDSSSCGSISQRHHPHLGFGGREKPFGFQRRICVGKSGCFISPSLAANEKSVFNTFLGV